VLEKLEKVDKLVIQVQRVVDALERIAGIRLKTSEDNIISWPESREEETETLERIDKRKQREQSLDGAEEEGMSQTSFSHISTNSSTIPVRAHSERRQSHSNVVELES